MIKLANKQLLETSFNSGLRKLENASGLTMKTNYQIMKIMRKIRQETTLLQQAFVKLVKEHAELDEKGEPKPNVVDGKPQPGTFFIPEEKAEAYKKARAEFDAMTFTIELDKILAPMIENVGFSPAELSAIDALIDFGDAESVDAV